MGLSKGLATPAFTIVKAIKAATQSRCFIATHTEGLKHMSLNLVTMDAGL